MSNNSKKTKKALDTALIICAVIGVIFTIVMICLFIAFQSVPDSLVVAVFGAIFGECGFCSLIINQKLKNSKNYVSKSDLG